MIRFFLLFIFFDEGIEDPNTAIKGHDSPTINAGLVTFSRGSGPVLQGNPIFCDFSGGGAPDPFPLPLDPPMVAQNNNHS